MFTTMPAWQRLTLLVLAGIAVVALFFLTFTAGRVAASPSHPNTTSADAGFARDMQVHHAQAVQMSMMLRDRTEDETPRTIAYDVAMTQQQQMGQMYAWLQEWGLPQSSAEPRMAWMTDASMGHSMETGSAAGMESTGSAGSMALAADGLMPGMATPEQLEELAAASGDDAERIYLTLMIEHHRAGVEMAAAGVELAATDQVRTLAEKIEESQQAEIEVMQALLDEL
ncbi:DUF305 domain-containing protein [Arthrobacter sp. H41]|uniref:DUF305 domain-containing protein n=1 Tax=Arthrobacter sp. H41 TaxID=1312978 RepID=UPI0004B44DEE|nr:DUF305 domain-containing protein [Arthrobacter sp. H41]